MYNSYNSQKVLQEARVRDLLDNAQPQNVNQINRVGQLVAALSQRLAAANERMNVVLRGILMAALRLAEKAAADR